MLGRDPFDDYKQNPDQNTATRSDSRKITQLRIRQAVP